MKLLVCVSKTPETTTKIKFNADNTALDANGVQYIMNPYDEWYALVRAIELKEKFGGQVTIINVGPAGNDSTLRKGLAIGADEAVRINAEPQSALYTAKQIANYAESQGFDAVLLGKETIDYNGSSVGAMVAEYLGLPFLSYASKLTMENEGTVIVDRDIEGGTEQVEVALPIVLSAAKGLAEQRIPNMRGIMMAKRKPLKVEEPVEFDDAVVTVEFQLPEEKGAVTLVDPENMDELVRLLHEEAKVI
ncbi:MAG: electron transfer flavoprotein subunit beta/FixA family protein [Saprospiraceae bacterium]